MGSGQSLLLVHGNPTSRLPLVRLLSDMPHHLRVHDVSSLDEAHAWLNSETPDVILVERYVNGQDGLAFCRAIRSMAWGVLPSLIVLTPVVVEAALHEILDAGADDYLPKPILPRDLRIRVRLAIRQAALRRSCMRAG